MTLAQSSITPENPSVNYVGHGDCISYYYYARDSVRNIIRPNNNVMKKISSIFPRILRGNFNSIPDSWLDFKSSTQGILTDGH